MSWHERARSSCMMRGGGSLLASVRPRWLVSP